MKPFNLEEYLKNPSRKVVTREGRSVRVLCVDKKGGEFPIIALIQQCTRDNEIIGTFTKDGKWSITIAEQPNDLFFAPEKHEGWIIINKWPDGVRDTNGIIYDTELDIPNKPQVGTHRVATVKVEWEE